MIRKTQKFIKRKVKADKTYLVPSNQWKEETVLINTWWLFWIIPVYSTEKITGSSL